jgi:hypothetical protein
MARKWPWHENTLKSYEKDRLPDVDYLYALSVETGFNFAELLKKRISVGVLSEHQYLKVDAVNIVSEVSADFLVTNDECTDLVVNDDSMFPTITVGAVISIDSEDKTLREGAIYAVKLNEKVVPRRIQKGLGGSVILVSDNARFVPITLTADQAKSLTVLGVVKTTLNAL